LPAVGLSGETAVAVGSGIRDSGFGLGIRASPVNCHVGGRARAVAAGNNNPLAPRASVRRRRERSGGVRRRCEPKPEVLAAPHVLGSRAFPRQVQLQACKRCMQQPAA
jgi:hypothetical protein